MNRSINNKCYKCYASIGKSGSVVGVPSVLLHCECLILICQGCAKDQLLNSRDPYRSPIKCPQCSQATHAILECDTLQAQDREQYLISYAMSEFGIRATTRQNANSNHCLDSLVDAFRRRGLEKHFVAYDDMSIKIQKFLVARVVALWQLRTLEHRDIEELKVMSLPGGPIDTITLKPNIVAERIFEGVKEFNGQCIVCFEALSNASVLFECNCLVSLCQVCAFETIASQQDTYHNGIKCPICKEISRTLVNADDVSKAEDILIQDSFKYFKCEKNDVNAHSDVFALYEKLCEKVQEYLKIIPGARKIEKYEALYSILMIKCLKLETSRLELFRQELVTPNGQILKIAYASYLPLGPLRHLQICRNVFLEYALGINSSNKLGDDEMQGEDICLPTNDHARVALSVPPLLSGEIDGFQSCMLCERVKVSSISKLKTHLNKCHRTESIGQIVLEAYNWDRCHRCTLIFACTKTKGVCPYCISSSRKAIPSITSDSVAPIKNLDGSPATLVKRRGRPPKSMSAVTEQFQIQPSAENYLVESPDSRVFNEEIGGFQFCMFCEWRKEGFIFSCLKMHLNERHRSEWIGEDVLDAYNWNRCHICAILFTCTDAKVSSSSHSLSACFDCISTSHKSISSTTSTGSCDVIIIKNSWDGMSTISDTAGHDTSISILAVTKQFMDDEVIVRDDLEAESIFDLNDEDDTQRYRKLENFELFNEEGESISLLNCNRGSACGLLMPIVNDLVGVNVKFAFSDWTIVLDDYEEFRLNKGDVLLLVNYGKTRVWYQLFKPFPGYKYLFDPVREFSKEYVKLMNAAKANQYRFSYLELLKSSGDSPAFDLNLIDGHRLLLYHIVKSSRECHHKCKFVISLKLACESNNAQSNLQTLNEINRHPLSRSPVQKTRGSGCADIGGSNQLTENLQEGFGDVNLGEKGTQAHAGSNKRVIPENVHHFRAQTETSSISHLYRHRHTPCAQSERFFNLHSSDEVTNSSSLFPLQLLQKEAILTETMLQSLHSVKKYQPSNISISTAQLRRSVASPQLLMGHASESDIYEFRLGKRTLSADLERTQECSIKNLNLPTSASEGIGSPQGLCIGNEFLGNSSIADSTYLELFDSQVPQFNMVTNNAVIPHPSLFSIQQESSLSLKRCFGGDHEIDFPGNNSDEIEYQHIKRKNCADLADSAIAVPSKIHTSYQREPLDERNPINIRDTVLVAHLMLLKEYPESTCELSTLTTLLYKRFPNSKKIIEFKGGARPFFGAFNRYFDVHKIENEFVITALQLQQLVTDVEVWNLSGAELVNAMDSSGLSPYEHGNYSSNDHGSNPHNSSNIANITESNVDRPSRGKWNGENILRGVELSPWSEYRGDVAKCLYSHLISRGILKAKKEALNTCMSSFYNTYPDSRLVISGAGGNVIFIKKYPTMFSLNEFNEIRTLPQHSDAVTRGDDILMPEVNGSCVRNTKRIRTDLLEEFTKSLHEFICFKRPRSLNMPVYLLKEFYAAFPKFSNVLNGEEDLKLFCSKFDSLFLFAEDGACPTISAIQQFTSIQQSHKKDITEGILPVECLSNKLADAKRGDDPDPYATILNQVKEALPEFGEENNSFHHYFQEELKSCDHDRDCNPNYHRLESFAKSLYDKVMKVNPQNLTWSMRNLSLYSDHQCCTEFINEIGGVLTFLQLFPQYFKVINEKKFELVFHS